MVCHMRLAFLYIPFPRKYCTRMYGVGQSQNRFEKFSKLAESVISTNCRYDFGTRLAGTRSLSQLAFLHF